MGVKYMMRCTKGLEFTYCENWSRHPLNDNRSCGVHNGSQQQLTSHWVGRKLHIHCPISGTHTYTRSHAHRHTIDSLYCDLFCGTYTETNISPNGIYRLHRILHPVALSGAELYWSPFTIQTTAILAHTQLNAIRESIR